MNPNTFGNWVLVGLGGVVGMLAAWDKEKLPTSRHQADQLRQHIEQLMQLHGQIESRVAD